MRALGGEGSGNVYDLLVPPDQHQTRLLCDNRHLDSFQILLIRIGNEGHNILRIDNDTIRSRDSEILSSVPSSPTYFFSVPYPDKSEDPVPARRSLPIRRLLRSLHFLMRWLTSGRRNRRCSFRSVGAFLFVPRHTSIEASVCTLEEPVAPPIPSSGPAAEQDDDIARIRISRITAERGLP